MIRERRNTEVGRTPRLWACVLLPSLALDGALRSRAPLTRPFALVGGTAQRRTLVAVNAAARACGLHPRQRLAEAEALCGDLLTEPHKPRHLEQHLKLIAAWACRYSGDILLDPPRALALEVGHSMALFGPWPAFAARLRAELTGLGFRHRIALAPNPWAAHVLAGIADGTVAADATALARALRDVPITRARLPPGATEMLGDMGIHDLGPLLALPRAAVLRRFGKGFLDSLDTLTGTRPAALQRFTPPERFATHIELDAEVHGVQGLLFPIRRMLGDLAVFVTARDSGVQHFTLRFVHHEAPSTDIRISLLAPERRAATLFGITQLRLERVRLRQPVLELALSADELLPFTPPGEDLFERRTANALPWPQLLERLRARLGTAAVHGLALDPDPRPERASSHTAPRASAPRLPLRPAWLLPQPLPLSRPPARILAGPERIETGWWDGGDIRRDYYIVELPTGQRAWVFRPPGQGGGFMLHGWFA